MSFLERLRQASYRGVPFHVDSDEVTDGKAVALHEVLDPDTEFFAEELGRTGMQVRVNAYLTGDDYAAKRDRLVEAMLAPGPGRLQLPDREPVQAIALPWVSRQSFGPGAEGRIARLEIPFVRVSGAAAPVARDDTAAVTRSLSEDVLAAAEQAFGDLVEVVGQDQEVYDAALEDVAAIGEAIAAAVQAAAATGSDVAELVRDATELADAPSALLSQSGAEIGGVLAALYARLADLEADPERLFDAFAALSETFSTVSGTGSTPVEQQTLRNRNAFAALTRRASLASRIQVATSLPVESAQDAAELRDRLADEIDDELVLAGASEADDEVFARLQDLLAGISLDLDERAARLPTRRTLRIPGPQSSLTLAYALYGNLERERELVERNRLLHPSFVLAGTEVEYLAGG